MVVQTSLLPLPWHFITDLAGSGHLFLHCYLVMSSVTTYARFWCRPFSTIHCEKMSILIFCVYKKKNIYIAYYLPMTCLAMHQSELWEEFVEIHTHIHTYIHTYIFLIEVFICQNMDTE